MLNLRKKLKLSALKCIVCIFCLCTLIIIINCEPIHCTARHCGRSEYVIRLIPSFQQIKEGVYAIRGSIEFCKYSCAFSIKFDKPVNYPVTSTCRMQDNQLNCNEIYPYLVSDIEVLTIAIPIYSERTNISLEMTFQNKIIYSIYNNILVAEKIQPNGPGCEPICYQQYREELFSYE